MSEKFCTFADKISESRDTSGSLMTNIQISIICPAFNCVSTIRCLIDSVLTQSCDAYELIVVDGASTDGTVEAIKEYGNRVRFISEPDNGIYDAMNKGVDMARGKWVYFIGADDYLYAPDVIEQVIPSLTNDSDLVLCRIMSPKFGIGVSDMSRRMYRKNTMHHQGIIYRRSVVASHPYDTAYRIMADYDLNLYAMHNNLRATQSDVVLAFHSPAGISGQPHFINYKEEICIRNKYLTNPFCKLYYTAFSLLKYTFKNLVLCWSHSS